jgi:RNA polymerase sigma-54 factor
LQTANWLTKSLDQRARTILKVAEEVVVSRTGFLPTASSICARST